MPKTTKTTTKLLLAEKVTTLQLQQRHAYWSGKTAAASWQTHKDNALEMIRLMTQLIEDQAAPASPTWADAETMARLAGDLQSIAEYMTGTNR